MVDQHLPGGDAHPDPPRPPLCDAPDPVLRRVVSGARLVSAGLAIAFIATFLYGFSIVAAHAAAPSLETNPAANAVLGGLLGVFVAAALSVGHFGWWRLASAEGPAPFDAALRRLVKRTVLASGLLLVLLPGITALRLYGDAHPEGAVPSSALRNASLAAGILLGIMNLAFVTRYFAGVRLLSRMCARFGDGTGSRGARRLIRASAGVAALYAVTVGAIVTLLAMDEDSPLLAIAGGSMTLLSLVALFLLMWYARVLRRVRRNAESFLHVRRFTSRGATP